MILKRKLYKSLLNNNNNKISIKINTKLNYKSKILGKRI